MSIEKAYKEGWIDGRRKYATDDSMEKDWETSDSCADVQLAATGQPDDSRKSFEKWAADNLPIGSDDIPYCTEDTDPYEIWQAALSARQPERNAQQPVDKPIGYMHDQWAANFQRAEVMGDFRVVSSPGGMFNTPLYLQPPEREASERDAKRYRWLRTRDLDTISKGGVFAGMTPDNIVLNEEDLDQAVDVAMTEEQVRRGTETKEGT